MSKVDAIVVLYNSSLDQVQAFYSSASNMVNNIYFVDNSDFISEELVLFISGCAHANYIPMEGNKGIAAAQNMGAKLAFDNQADFIILFDQDSHINSGFVNDLMECYIFANTHFNGKVAAVGPTPVSDVTGQAYDRLIDRIKYDENSYTSIKQIIASGCLIPKSAWNIVGEMKEELFIDAVDHEWCWRAVSKGMKIIRSNEVLMPHRLGWYDVNLMGFKFCVGAPIRHYYQYRNYFYLLKFFHVPLYWKVKTGLSYALKLISYPFFVSPRVSRLNFMLKGIQHGLRSKMGVYK